MVLQSMTGFAQAESQHAAYRINWRIKSVNHRFLEISFRLPEALADLEGPARNMLKEVIGRGHVECFLNVSGGANGDKGMLELNQPLLNNLAQVEKQAYGGLRGKKNKKKHRRKEITRPGLTVGEMLRWPGMVREKRVLEDETVRTNALICLQRAVENLVLFRSSEGEALQRMMSAQVVELLDMKQRIVERLPLVKENVAKRVETQVQEVVQTVVDPARLAQEVALLLTRMDIGEEVDRFGVHVMDFQNSLSQGGVIGRRLDFLCQEMYREVNTLCAKTPDREISRLGVDMKVVVEKLREQVQNIQ